MMMLYIRRVANKVKCCLCTLALMCCGAGTAWHAAKTPDFQPPIVNVCVWLPAAQRPAALQAVALWADAIAPWRRLVIANRFDCDYMIIEVSSTPDADPRALAFVDDIGGRVVKLVRGRYEFDTLGIVLHELGHAFGAQHITNTIMSPIWHKGQTCPDIVTVAQVAAFNHWELAQMGYCF